MKMRRKFFRHSLCKYMDVVTGIGMIGSVAAAGRKQCWDKFHIPSGDSVHEKLWPSLLNSLTLSRLTHTSTNVHTNTHALTMCEFWQIQFWSSEFISEQNRTERNRTTTHLPPPHRLRFPSFPLFSPLIFLLIDFFFPSQSAVSCTSFFSAQTSKGKQSLDFVFSNYKSFLGISAIEAKCPPGWDCIQLILNFKFYLSLHLFINPLNNNSMDFTELLSFTASLLTYLLTGKDQLPPLFETVNNLREEETK